MKNLQQTFEGASVFTGNDVSKWNVQSVTDFNNVFDAEPQNMEDCVKQSIYDTWSTKGLDMSLQYSAWATPACCIKTKSQLQTKLELYHAGTTTHCGDIGT